MYYTIAYQIPSAYLRHNDSFITVQFSLDNIKQHEIDKIPTWLHAVNKHEDVKSTHQININGSHPFITAILHHVIAVVPTYTKLSYIHIHHAENPLIDSTIHKLVQAVRQHPNGENITVHIDSSRAQLYL